MPYGFVDAKKAYKLKLDGETPIANVVPLGTGRYIEVCPACGCLHEIRHPLPAEGATVQPTCTVPRLAAIFAPIRARWLKQHPETAGYSSVKLAYQPPAVIIQLAGIFQPSEVGKIAA